MLSGARRASLMLLVMLLTTSTAWAETVTLTSGTGAVTLNNGDVLTGTGGADTHVTIADGATVTLSGVTIHPDCGTDHNQGKDGCKWAGISCAGTATIILAENTTNTVKGFCHHHPGIFVPSGSTLTIQGSGTLNASNGEGPDGKSYAAGIGGGYKVNCGDIVIRSGNITATGGSDAAGIGSGEYNSACGNIVISGGIVNATGGYGAAGIGSGANYSSSYGAITISGGTVTATGGDYAAGIGAGTGSQDGTQSQNGDIQITGGSVTATGGTNGAGIGSAGYSSSSKSNCGNITIVRGTIKSTKGTSAPNSIGAGLYGTCGTVTVGGVVGAKTDNFDQTIVGDTYTVSFNANGGTGDMSNQTIYRGIATPLTRNTFTRDGYVFIGWSETADGDVAYPDCKKVTDLAEKNGTKTLYAKWMSTSDIPSGFQVDAEYAQTEAGFYYVNMPADRSSISVNINAPKYYTFKIYDNGGKDGDYYCSNEYTQSATFTVPEGYKIGLNGTITINKEEVYDVLRVYDGSSSSATRLYIYNFNTHYVNTSSTSNSITLEFEEAKVNSGTYPDKGFDITATVAPVNYTVSFNANGGEGSMAVQNFTYNEGAKALTQNAYTRDGYTFAGWATTAGGNVTYTDGAEVSNLATTDGTVIELFAKWTANTYSVRFNGNGNTSGSMDNESFTYDEAAKALTANAFTRTGYTFAGWATSAEGAVIYADQAEVQNLTATANGIFDLYAKWTENVATLTEANPIAPLTAWSGQQTKVTFTRSGLTAGAYSTICLPYNFTASETCTFYKFDGVKKVGDDWVADISTTTGGTANTPYIFTTDATSVTFSNNAVVAASSYSDTDAKTTITDWTFQGTYSQISLPKTGEYDYGFAAGDGSTVAIGTFVHLKSGASAAPFRAYLKYTGSDDNWAKAPNRAGAANDAMPSRIIVRIVGADGGTTDIGTLDTRTGEISTGEWFDLNGRRLQGKPSTKGVYINNGKKVVIK